MLRRRHEEEAMAKDLTEHLPQSLAFLSLSSAASHSAWTPNTDVYETADHLVVKMEIAGIDKDDLEITLNDRLLLVRGYRKDPCRQRQHRCSFRQMEIDYGYFERRIVIPRSVDGSRVRAQFHNGFLHVELPKSQHSEHTTVTVIIEQPS
jgi:HSP20 family protein